ncbi:hypothetical protein [Lunatibacter salilacus]|uniref:hypothetical protein n=1 Tax=Lunatibacter salilacus TaxID=2483804 RepID=UPI00131B723C|nr:hypothetical protein [Lunatibacter salilacus]
MKTLIKKSLYLFVFFCVGFPFPVVIAQVAAEIDDEVLLELYNGARVTDVVDGMVPSVIWMWV